jgi:hypothetical protein
VPSIHANRQLVSPTPWQLTARRAGPCSFRHQRATACRPRRAVDSAMTGFREKIRIPARNSLFINSRHIYIYFPSAKNKTSLSSTNLRSAPCLPLHSEDQDRCACTAQAGGPAFPGNSSVGCHRQRLTSHTGRMGDRVCSSQLSDQMMRCNLPARRAVVKQYACQRGGAPYCRCGTPFPA